jgi:hypothetical protein
LVADGPRCLHEQSVIVGLVLEVCELFLDGPPQPRGQSVRSELVADGPRCLHEQSVIVGLVLEVCELFLDGPPQPRGQSA